MKLDSHVHTQHSGQTTIYPLSLVMRERPFTSLNHVASGVNGPVTAPHVAALLPWGDALETNNGSRLPAQNLTAQCLAEASGKPGIAGSDAHTKRGVGRTWTEVPGARNRDEFQAACRWCCRRPAASSVTPIPAMRGWLSRTGSRLAHAVRSAVSRPDDARLAAASETARHLDWSRVASRFLTLDEDLHRRRHAASPAAPAPIRLRLANPAPPDFALSTTVSHRIVTGLGHPALQESEVTE